jgi:GNAT superfamily N-acetyltransferase
MTIVVRRARKEDAATVSAMCLALNEDEAVPGRRFTPQAMLRDAFAPEPRFILLVAERAGVVVGYALATPSYESNWAAPGLCVGDIYVAPPARRRGVARALVAALAAQARREGRAYLWWTSLPGNAGAREFYRALGSTTEHLHAHALAGDEFVRLADEGRAAIDA